MTNRRLVSTVTGTWCRHALVLEMLANARAQTYRPLEHVVVSDGPDPELRELIAALPQGDFYGEHPPIIYQELGFWASGLLTDSISAAPFLTAQLLAQGAYGITMSDDERFLDSDAIKKLVDAIELGDADFAYSNAEMTCTWSDERAVIGCDPPRPGDITQLLYRREALDIGMLFRTHVGAATDWDCTRRMMAAGARWAYVPEVLVSHRADK